MKKPFKIYISAVGPIGCGKTRAIDILTQAIAKHPDFQWIDGRFIEVSGWKDTPEERLIEETQMIELRMK